MITKGIIVKKISEYTYRVRLPILDGTSKLKSYIPDENLGIASAIITPGVDNIYKEGDLVYVSFEDNTTSKLIILGHLDCAKLTDRQLALNANIITAEALNVLNSVQLPKNTKIGDLTYADLLNGGASPGTPTNIYSTILKKEDWKSIVDSGVYYTAIEKNTHKLTNPILLDASVIKKVIEGDSFTSAEPIDVEVRVLSTSTVKLYINCDLPSYSEYNVKIILQGG